MLDLNQEIDLEAYNKLKQHLGEASGLNFCLAMRQEDGTVSIHPRNDQPCQGGEMRRYFDTHGDACTRPDDPRPGDLEYPFPEGIVEGVSVLLGTDDLEFITAAFSEDSPWINGFNSPDSVDIGMYESDYREFCGIILRDTDVDPTVFVNLLQLTQYPGYQQWIKQGFSRRESLLLVALLHVGPNLSLSSPRGSYHFSASPSIRRFLESNPKKFGEKTWREGEDYNRPDINSLFHDDGEKNFIQEIYNRGFPEAQVRMIIGYELIRPVHGCTVYPTDYKEISKIPHGILSEMGLLINYSKPVMTEIDPDLPEPTWEGLTKIIREILDEEYAKIGG